MLGAFAGYSNGEPQNNDMITWGDPSQVRANRRALVKLLTPKCVAA